MNWNNKLARLLVHIGAKYYLKKPDHESILHVKFPSLQSAFYAVMNELCFILGFQRSFRLTTLNLEIINSCNLNCKMCPVNHGMARKKSAMSWELFKKIIDENLQLDFVLLFQWGEPLLHPRLIEMIQYCTINGIRTMITSNGTLLNDEINKKLIESGLARITFSIDGIGDTHTRIRGFDYNRLKENILNFKEMRDRLNSPLRIDTSMVAFDDNEQEIRRYKKEWSGVADRVQVIPLITKGKRHAKCRELWRGSMIILSDGTVTVCCVDYEGELNVGNVNDKCAVEIYNGPEMRKIRKLHRRGEFPSLCAACSEYEHEDITPRFK